VARPARARWPSPLEADRPIDLAAALRAVGADLPAHMVPARIDLVEALPVTPTARSTTGAGRPAERSCRGWTADGDLGRAALAESLIRGTRRRGRSLRIEGVRADALAEALRHAAVYLYDARCCASYRSLR
jgi:hypothetical protein